MKYYEDVKDDIINYTANCLNLANTDYSEEQKELIISADQELEQVGCEPEGMTTEQELEFDAIVDKYAKKVLALEGKNILSGRNQQLLESYLTYYLAKVLAEEDNLNTFEKLYQDAYRVKVYGNRKYLSIGLIEDYLRGLPINIAYANYEIVEMLLQAIPDSENYTYEEEELVDWYWETLARIIDKEDVYYCYNQEV